MTPDPRYIVSAVTGYSINPAAGPGAMSGQVPARTAYYVLDRAYCHRVVASFEVRSNRTGIRGVSGSDEHRRALADAKAAELNAWDAAL